MKPRHGGGAEEFSAAPVDDDVLELLTRVYEA